VDIAKSRGADKDAPEIFPKAYKQSANAENALASKADKKDIVSKAAKPSSLPRMRAHSQLNGRTKHV